VTVNNSRSQNAELAEGMSDGTYKKITTDRGGPISPETWEAKADLSDAHFGIHEARVKHLPDGSVHVTPDYLTNPLQPGGITFQ
jgi:hypothetical protein